MIARSALALVLILAFSCTSTGSIETRIPVSRSIGEHRSVRLVVTSEVKNAEEVIGQLEGVILAKLESLPRIQKVASGSAAPGAGSDLIVHVTILKLHKVSRIDRHNAGALAGRARVLLDVELVDGATGGVVGACTVDGKSSGGSVFAGTTDHAIDQAVEKVIEFITT